MIFLTSVARDAVHAIFQNKGSLAWYYQHFLLQKIWISIDRKYLCTHQFYSVRYRNPTSVTIQGLSPYKKQENPRKSYMVIYESLKVIENSPEIYGNMQVIKRP